MRHDLPLLVHDNFLIVHLLLGAALAILFMDNCIATKTGRHGDGLLLAWRRLALLNEGESLDLLIMLDLLNTMEHPVRYGFFLVASDRGLSQGVVGPLLRGNDEGQLGLGLLGDRLLGLSEGVVKNLYLFSDL